MKIISPSNISFSWRIIGFRKEHLLLMTALGAYDLDDPETLLPNGAAWEIFAQCRGDKFSEEGIPKLLGEALIAGSCHQPNGIAAPTCTVSMRVGPIFKQLLVLGDRLWTPLGDSFAEHAAPTPFVSMPIVWERAFGGPQFKENKIGTGMVEMMTEGGRKVVVMPNIEYPNQLIVSPKDRPLPASFESQRGVRVVDPKRFGTYDEKWLLEDWPNTASDTDLTLLNWSLSDQQLKEGYFRGDEQIELTNLHPTEPVIQSHLPGRRIHFCLRRTHMTQTVIDKRRGSLDTIWLFPEHKKAVVAWRAITQVADEELSQVSHLIVFNESLTEPSISPEDYERLAEEKIAELEAPRVVSPAPPKEDKPNVEEVEEASVENATSPKEDAVGREASEELQPPAMTAAIAFAEEETAKLLTEMESVFKKAGVDPALLHKEIDSLTQTYAAPTQFAEAKTGEEGAALIETLCSQAIDKLKATMARLGKMSPKTVDEILDTHLDHENPPTPEETLAALKKVGIPEDKLLELREAYAAADAEMQSVLKDLPAEPELPPEPEVVSKEEMPRGSVVGFIEEEEEDLPPPPEPKATLLTVEDVKQRVADGQSLTGLDLTGMDLSQCDLTGADFSAAILERTVLRDAVLKQAKFDDALLAGACLDGADLSEASLQRVQADGVSAKGAQCTATNFEGADLHAAQLSQTNMAGANLNRANLSQADLTESDLSDVRAEFAQFVECSATKAIFTKAHLKRAAFTEAQLDEADFSHIDAPHIDLSQAQGSAVNFTQARLHKSRSTGESRFPKARFDNANLSEANWFEADFSEACFDNANLVRATCSACVFQKATLLRAVAKRARFDKSDFTQADMRGINLLYASARFARFIHANIQRANMYSADVYKGKFHKTLLDGTNIKRTLLQLDLGLGKA